MIRKSIISNRTHSYVSPSNGLNGLDKRSILLAIDETANAATYFSNSKTNGWERFGAKILGWLGTSLLLIRRVSLDRVKQLLSRSILIRKKSYAWFNLTRLVGFTANKADDRILMNLISLQGYQCSSRPERRRGIIKPQSKIARLSEF